MKSILHPLSCILSFVSLCLCVFALNACTTSAVVSTSASGVTTTNTVTMLDTNAVIGVINTVVPFGVNYAVTKDPNAGPYLAQVAIILQAASTTGTYNPTNIQQSLAAISISQLRNNEAVVIEETVLSIYQSAFAKTVDSYMGQVVWLKPVLNALANAINQGLALAAPTGIPAVPISPPPPTPPTSTTSAVKPLH